MYILLFVILFCAALCDLRYFRIPNKLIILGFLSSISILIISFELETLLTRIVVSLIIFFLLFVFFQAGTLGAGDIKLIMMMSLFLNYNEVLLVVFISLSITVVQIIIVFKICHIRANLKTTLPLAVSLFWGYWLWQISIFF